MHSFYSCAKSADETLLLVKDTKGNRFGAFCTAEWHHANYFYGTGESFLWRSKGAEIDTYTWTGESDQFQFSDGESLAIGGGVSGSHGLCIQ